MPILQFDRRRTAKGVEHLVVRKLPPELHRADEDGAGLLPDSPAQGAAGDDAPGRGDADGERTGDLAQCGLAAQEKTGHAEHRPAVEGAIVVPDCYRPDVLTHVVHRTLDGDSLADICRGTDMPSAGVVRQWLSRDPSFRAAYVEAQKATALTYVSDMVAIADSVSGDVQRDRLRISTRKTIAERLCPEFAPPKKEDASGVGALAKIFEAASNQGHVLPGETVEAEFEEKKPCK